MASVGARSKTWPEPTRERSQLVGPALAAQGEVVGVLGGEDEHRRDGLDPKPRLLGRHPYPFHRRSAADIGRGAGVRNGHDQEGGARLHGAPGVLPQCLAGVPVGEQFHDVAPTGHLQRGHLGRLQFQRSDVDPGAQVVAGPAELARSSPGAAWPSGSGCARRRRGSRHRWPAAPRRSPGGDGPLRRSPPGPASRGGRDPAARGCRAGGWRGGPGRRGRGRPARVRCRPPASSSPPRPNGAHWGTRRPGRAGRPRRRPPGR